MSDNKILLHYQNIQISLTNKRTKKLDKFIRQQDQLDFLEFGPGKKAIHKTFLCIFPCIGQTDKVIFKTEQTREQCLERQSRQTDDEGKYFFRYFPAKYFRYLQLYDTIEDIISFISSPLFL